jgi:hypothetical protein
VSEGAFHLGRHVLKFASFGTGSEQEFGGVLPPCAATIAIDQDDRVGR